MKVLVTGGSGFIGTELCNLLKNKENDVTSFDVRKSNIVPTINGDICNINHLKKATKGFDAVFHFAALLGVKRTEQNPLKTIEVNLMGTKNVLEACRLNDIKRIVFSSSSEIYGEPLKVPIKETDLPRPKSTYGVSKLASEELIKAYGEVYGIKYNIVRLFNVYGTGQSEDFVIPKFVKLSLSSKPIILYGNGMQVRSFANIKDVAGGILLSLKKDNEIFNIGNNKEPITMKNLGKKICNILNKPFRVKYVKFSNTDRSETREIYKRIPDIDKARKMLGYEPRISLETGIKTVIEYLRKWHAKNNLS
jgi:UDP-glucose 4-epimerase